MMKPFFIKYDRKVIRVIPEEVTGFDTERNYTRVYLTNGSYHMVRSTMINMLRKVPPNVFVQVHRSYAVSIYHVDYLLRDHLLIGEEIVPVSKRYYPSLVKKLNVIGGEVKGKMAMEKIKLPRLNSKATLAKVPEAKTLKEAMKEKVEKEFWEGKAKAKRGTGEEK